MKFQLTIFGIMGCLVMTAQNLVINPSFEDTVACPDLPYQVEHAVGWTAWFDTPDYCNECSTVICDAGYYCVHVPDNIFGYQYAASGNAYMGMYCYGNGKLDAKEIIGGQLYQPLLVGETYYISFKVNLSLDGYYGFHWTCNNIGLKFSHEAYDSEENPVPIDNTAHLLADYFITDTANWTTVEGTYIAEEAFSYFGIGNFFDQASTDTLHLNAPSSGGVYFFIDDICISADPNCTPFDYVQDANVAQEIQLFNDRIFLSIENILRLSVYDLNGRLTCEWYKPLSGHYYSLAGLLPNFYVIAVETDSGYFRRLIYLP